MNVLSDFTAEGQAALNNLGPRLESALTLLRENWVWYLMWVGFFGATFLLLRMLITRWGDTNVTRKALALSLLVHAVGGLFTTTVEIARSSTLAVEPEPIPVRRFVVQGEQPEIRPEPGNVPVWEKLPQPKLEELTRVEQPPLELAPLEIQPKRPAPVETAAVNVPDLPDLPQLNLPNAVPQAVDTAPRLPRVAEGSPAAIPEETAEARAEVDASSTTPARQSRASSGMQQVDINRPARTGVPGEFTADIEPTRAMAALTVPADPTATVRRGLEADSPQRRSAPTPEIAPVDNPGVTEQNPSPQIGRGAPTESPFSRIGRRPVPDNPGATVQRLRPNNAPGTTNPETGPLIAAREGMRSPQPDGLTPNIVRPDFDDPARRPTTRLPATYRLRNLPQRKRIAIEMGATEDSERSVELSLQWLALHQSAEGFWNADGFTENCPPGDRCQGLAAFGRDPYDAALNVQERQRSGMDADSGLTGLSILAFLGAGYTHEEGIYADNLDRAIRWLIRNQDEEGYLGGKAGRYARMYCHGMAAIALGEAYGMTNDPTLLEPLTAAVKYIVDQQNTTDGGWRYVKGQLGDMSIFGWQLMALKSAMTAGVTVPQATLDRAVDFLKKAGQGQFGGLAAYRKDEKPRPSMTAEALFSRQVLGMKRTNPASTEAMDYLLKHLPRRSDHDLYYWYYGTLAAYQHGGKPWQSWNESLRDTLVAEQRTDGHAKGSWDPRAPWGDFGGRVFSTAVSTLCLEVYYRFLPMHQLGGRYDESAE